MKGAVMVRHCGRCHADFDDEFNVTICPHDSIMEASLAPAAVSLDCIDDLIRCNLEELIAEEMTCSIPWWRLAGES